MEERIFIYKGPFSNLGCFFDREDFLIKIALLNKNCKPTEDHPFFRELDNYFKGNLKIFRQKFKIINGTDFEKDVWDFLKNIPYGETKTYKWVAERIGRKKAVRAIGQALKKNPLPIILPCHRVINSNGSIGGFSWGREIKKFLLELEKINV